MHAAGKIRDIEFSDLYLGHPAMPDRFSDLTGAKSHPIPDNPALRDEVDAMIALCHATLARSPADTEFRICHDAVAYRVSAIPTFGGTVFALRKVPDRVCTLTELGIPAPYVRHLLREQLSGLLIVSGACRSGKTTTACAILRDRLAAYGGVAVTGEDPVEFPLEGRYGPGICFQTGMPRGCGEFEAAFQRLLRWGARVILIDEIRDPVSAAEVLRASMDGHLIITTMLAESVVQAISKFQALAANRLGLECSHSLLAEGLAGVLHQRFTAGSRAKLATECLFLKEAPVTRAILRSGKYDMLGAEIRQQLSVMINTSAASERVRTE
jgi:Tfp pilus assembly pilus retraction ATPase PilT